MEIAITRSTALSADSSLGAVGTTVFRLEAAGDGAGDTDRSSVAHWFRGVACGAKKSTRDQEGQPRRPQASNTHALDPSRGQAGANVARPRVLEIGSPICPAGRPFVPMSLKQFVIVR